MKIDFPITKEDYIEYCIKCYAANSLTSFRKDGDRQYKCNACQAVNPRAIIIDPKLKWEIAEDGEYCHESVGAFIFDSQGRFLAFKLNKFPFGWTIPAGHVDKGERAKQAVYREVTEETGLQVSEITQISRLPIDGDGCRRGSDRHIWTVFCARTNDVSVVKIDAQEGAEYKWITIQQAMSEANTYAVGYILKQLHLEIRSFSTK